MLSLGVKAQQLLDGLLVMACDEENKHTLAAESRPCTTRSTRWTMRGMKACAPRGRREDLSCYASAGQD